MKKSSQQFSFSSLQSLFSLQRTAAAEAHTFFLSSSSYFFFFSFLLFSETDPSGAIKKQTLGFLSPLPLFFFPFTFHFKEEKEKEKGKKGRSYLSIANFTFSWPTMRSLGHECNFQSHVNRS